MLEVDRLAQDDILALIAGDAWMMGALRAVAALDLADWWIVAGFVRSKVWDSQHGYRERTPIADVDVVFFDPGLPSTADREIEQRLGAMEPSYPWEVYNQAHMHTFNHDQPYRDSIDSFSRWAETVSTVGVRLTNAGHLELAAPHGLADLVEMVIRLTPHPDAKREIFLRRLREKRWIELWPKVRVVDE